MSKAFHFHQSHYERRPFCIDLTYFEFLKLKMNRMVLPQCFELTSLILLVQYLPYANDERPSYPFICDVLIV